MDTADSDPGSGPGGSGEGSPSDDTWGVRGARVRTSVACACSLGLNMNRFLPFYFVSKDSPITGAWTAF